VWWIKVVGQVVQHQKEKQNDGDGGGGLSLVENVDNLLNGALHQSSVNGTISLLYSFLLPFLQLSEKKSLQDCPPQKGFVRLKFKEAHMITLSKAGGFIYTDIQHVHDFHGFLHSNLSGGELFQADAKGSLPKFMANKPQADIMLKEINRVREAIYNNPIHCPQPQQESVSDGGEKGGEEHKDKPASEKDEEKPDEGQQKDQDVEEKQEDNEEEKKDKGERPTQRKEGRRGLTIKQSNLYIYLLMIIILLLFIIINKSEQITGSVKGREGSRCAQPRATQGLACISALDGVTTLFPHLSRLKDGRNSG